MRIVIILLIAILSTACLRMDSFMFNPTKLEAYTLQNYTGGRFYDDMTAATDIPDSLIQLMTLTSVDKGNEATIYAVYIGDEARIGQDTVILYCHGNASHMDAYWDRAELLANVGGKNRYGVLMLDYRGYGMSEGSSTESSLYADVNTAMKWLKDMGLTGDRLVMYGFSLGTSAATEVTANWTVLKPMKLILEAPFASVNKIQQDANVISVPSAMYLNIVLDNAEEIKKIDQPFLWIHGEADDFIQIGNGELVYANHPGQENVDKFARRIPNGGHSTVPPIMGLEVYMKLVGDFIAGEL